MHMSSAVGLLIGLLLVSPLPALAQGKGTKAPGPLMLVDSAGSVVGRYDGFNTSNGQVFFVVNNVPIAMRVQTAPLSSSDLRVWPEELRFTSTDCSGTAYTNIQQAGVRPSIVIKQGSQYLAYIAAATATYSEVVFASVFRSATGCEPLTVSSEGIALSPPIDITGRFIEPFSIE